VSTAQRSWFSIANAGNAADLWIYDEIGGWGITAADFVAQLNELNVSDITLHLNSPGGSVFDGIAITNALRDHPAQVTVKVDAIAASIASVIAQAGNVIIMGRNSTMMIHNASGLVMGEAADMRKMADMLDATTQNIASVYADRAGGSLESWLEMMAAETWYSAQEAVDAGLADEVAALPTEKKAHAMAANFDLSIFNHAPTIVADVPELDSEPEPEPEPEPKIQTPWDASLFKAAVLASNAPKINWDPDLLRGAVRVVTSNAPVQPIRSARDARPDLLPTDPEPEPIPGWSGTGLFQAAIGLVTNDMPAPDNPQRPMIPVPGFDPNMFHLAIREANR
jgi:ATP-dependent protease ClpP protease subunit